MAGFALQDYKYNGLVTNPPPLTLQILSSSEP